MTKDRSGNDDVRERLGLAPSGDARDRPLPAQTRGAPAVRRSFGLPIAVSQVIDLPRAPTSREWEQLVSELRTIFGVQGRVTITGGLREWSHGNLHISLEPGANGERLRLSDLKDDAVAINGLGFGLGAMGLLLGGVMAAVGTGKPLMVVGAFGTMSLLAFFAANLVRTPAWARERARQMEAIAADVVKLLSK